jgi:hypothetical protein
MLIPFSRNRRINPVYKIYAVIVNFSPYCLWRSLGGRSERLAFKPVTAIIFALFA